MNICQAPSTSATPNAAKASQKCARMSFLLTNTAQSPAALRSCRELRLIDHLDLAPHALVADAAEFLAGHQIISGVLETHGLLGDEAGHQHGVDVGVLDINPVHYVGTGGAQRDRRLRRHQNATRGEGILLADRAYRHRAVRLEDAAEVRLHEFA